jgi:hypothetical protein
MKFNPFRFALIFWSIFIVVLSIHFYIRYTELIQEFSFMTGTVVDQVELYKRKRGFVMMPQIEYVIDDSARLFVSKTATLPTGEKPTLIYQTSDPHNIDVYSRWMWVDWSKIVPSFLICFLVFSVIGILASKSPPNPAILPSNSKAL